MYVRVCVCACVCVCERVCVCTLYAVTVSYIVFCHVYGQQYNFYIIKCKTYFEVILFGLDEAKFNNGSEQFEFGAHAACCMGYKIA